VAAALPCSPNYLIQLAQRRGLTKKYARYPLMRMGFVPEALLKTGTKLLSSRRKPCRAMDSQALAFTPLSPTPSCCCRYGFSAYRSGYFVAPDPAMNQAVFQRLRQAYPKVFALVCVWVFVCARMCVHMCACVCVCVDVCANVCAPACACRVRACVLCRA